MKTILLLILLAGCDVHQHKNLFVDGDECMKMHCNVVGHVPVFISNYKTADMCICAEVPHR
jgi:hypothetical protein